MKRRKSIGWSRTRQGGRAAVQVYHVDYFDGCQCSVCQTRAIVERAKLEMLLILLAEGVR